MNKIEKIRIPAIKVITISDNRTIHIDGQIFGKLVVKLFNDDDTKFVDGCEIQMSDYSGEYGCFITVPKAWINKKALVKYEKEVDCKILNSTTESWFKDIQPFVSNSQINIDGLLSLIEWTIRI